MDPNTNLAEQIELAAALQQAWDSNELLDPGDVTRLADLVLALNEWIAKDGFLPTAWVR